MHRALAFIEAHISEPIRLVDIAGAAALSPFHFSRSFKKASGLTPMKFVLVCRVNAAKAMLKNPDVQNIAIAYACGFASESHLSTSFKSVAGMTPTAWRQLSMKLSASIFLALEVFEPVLPLAA